MKIFLRETNIWRLIGGGLSLLAIILLLLFPSESFGDIIVYRTEFHLITIWHVLIMIGMIAMFLPTVIEIFSVIKEILIELRKKGNF